MSTNEDGVVDGEVAAGFEDVREALESMLRADPGFSAQVAAVWRGRTVVDLAGGPELDRDAITGVFSVSKGIAGTVIGLLLDRYALELDAPLANYWPEFAQRGKSEISVRTVLSHRAGVLGPPEGFTAEEFADSQLAASKLAASAPLWQPGAMHGYHALSIGIVMEELVRRVTGHTLQHLYETEVRAPSDIDFYLGLPDSQEARYRPVTPGRPTPELLAELPPPPLVTDSVQSVAFSAVLDPFDPIDGTLSPNNRVIRESGFASIGGAGSARGLAGVYAAVLGDDRRAPLWSGTTMDEMSREHSFGTDRVLGVSTSFGLVYMKPNPRIDFGSYAAFGHDGAAGALAFADPAHELAFGYIPLPMQLPGGADPKGVQLSQLVRACIRRAS
jgi:CubicO group peptidase (beta-lactamase class C family)